MAIVRGRPGRPQRRARDDSGPAASREPRAGAEDAAEGARNRREQSVHLQAVAAAFGAARGACWTRLGRGKKIN